MMRRVLFWGLMVSAVGCQLLAGLEERTVDGGGTDAAVVPDVSDGATPVDAACETCGGTKCIDLQKDPSNCGYCGRSCRGAACGGGLCPSTVLAAALSPTTAMAMDDTNVYFGALTQIRYVPKTGGAPKILVDLGSTVASMVLIQGTLYVATFNRVVHLPVSGGPVSIVSQRGDGGAYNIGVAAESPTVFWATTRGLWSADLDGGSLSALIAENDASPTGWTATNPGLAVDPSWVYFADQNYPGVLGAPRDGGATKVWVQGSVPKTIYPLVVTTAPGELYSGMTTGLFETPVTDAGPTNFLSANSVDALAISNGRLFWHESGFTATSAQFITARVGGGDRVLLADGLAASTYIAFAVDLTGLYWIDPIGTTFNLRWVPL